MTIICSEIDASINHLLIVKISWRSPFVRSPDNPCIYFVLQKAKVIGLYAEGLRVERVNIYAFFEVDGVYTFTILLDINAISVLLNESDL